MYKIQEYINAKKYSTMRIGGEFRYFTEIDNLQDIPLLINFASENKVKILILGSGSNVIFKNGLLNILAIKLNFKDFEIIEESIDFIDIKMGAGLIWDEAVKKTVEMNLIGLESLSHIPGTVGATPVQNVGAYGAEIKDTLLYVEAYNLYNDEICRISNIDCNFRYRDSIFKNEEKGKYIITSVVFRLKKNKDNNYDYISLKYPGVSNYLDKLGIKEPTINDIRNTIINIRKDKLPNPKEIPNVGSFFKNPIVSNDIINKIKLKYPLVISFPIDQYSSKIPAGWLIENADLKGKTFGNISVYNKNALVLINNGNASSFDLINAKEEIIRIIFDKFNITLEQEPELI